jgi:hypothetical protein
MVHWTNWLMGRPVAVPVVPRRTLDTGSPGFCPRTRDATVYGPPKGSHCAALSGPAKVRMSNVFATENR